MMLRKTLIISGLLLLLVFTTSAQDASRWQVTEARPLTLPNSASPRIFPAPDGRLAAYEHAVRLNGHRDFYLCVLDTMTEEEPRCALAPQPLPAGFEPDPNSPLVPFSWSPDGTKIAAVGQPLGTQADTDLWILDVASSEWRNLTDDGYDGALAASDGSPAPAAGVSIELQPAWSPDGAQIAVERSVIGENGALMPSTLSIIEVESGDIRSLAPLPGSAEGVLDAGSTTGLDWSPDGTTLAATVLHRELNPDWDGIWAFAVEGESQQLVGLEDVTGALQGVIAGLELTSLGPVEWSPDGTRLLFWAGNPGKRPAVAWPFLLDLDSREVMPVPVAAHPSDKPDRRVIRPLQAAWSPDGSALLLLTFGFPPDEATSLLDPQGETPRLSVRVVDTAAWTEQPLGHLPLGPSSAMYFASWGEGGAITNGYHLTIGG